MAGEPYAEVRKLLERAAARVALLPLVDRYRRAKRDARAIDFGDQMAIAARVADGFAEVGRAERARYAVVLLDEYQDTGHAQLTMLRGRCSAAATRSPRSATRASRSTAGAAPARTTCSGSPPTSGPGPATRPPVLPLSTSASATTS